jgi:urea transport system permease protein
MLGLAAVYAALSACTAQARTAARGQTAAEVAIEVGLPLAGLRSDDPDERIEAVESIALSGHALAGRILQAIEDERLVWMEARGWILLAEGETADTLAGGQTVGVNNRMRAALETARAFVALAESEVQRRREAATLLEGIEAVRYLEPLKAAWQRESDPGVRQALLLAVAKLRLQSPDASLRLEAVRALAQADSTAVRRQLQDLLALDSNGYREPDPQVREAAKAALGAMDARLRKFERIAAAFSGLSLGSVLLLAALGLAITYGLMGVINMAHGEFLMIGAYSTYLAQQLFRRFASDWIDWYVLAAVPFAFFASALVGIALERAVLRWLYGRPLETLLATWGVSLLLIQSCRLLFGAQNVEVENPSWLSGSMALASDIVLPYNRMAILAFALAVLFGVYLVLQKTRAGLFVRAVTQNRAMASCTGIPTDRVDTLTFGFGCGIAGLGGVALSQLGNVGPDLGQQYIVDSFMVVVLGGVGQLAGTAIAALGLGSVSKILEPFTGAVLAKITVLLFIIAFIQRRPQGLFALKGRSADA